MLSPQQLYIQLYIKQISKVKLSLFLRTAFTLIIMLYLTSSALSYAQSHAQSHDHKLFEEHISSMKQGMTVLGAWSLSNILIGGVMRQRTEYKQHYFHEMNATWNLVNLGIAGLGYFTLPDISQWTALEGLRELEKLDRILLFNAGLDIAYMALGYALIERGQRLASDRFLGYGRSLILQGAFLFVFDSAFAYLHSDVTDQFRMSLLPNLNGLSLNIQF